MPARVIRLFEAPPSSRLLRCVLGFAVAVAATLLRVTLEPVLAHEVPFVFHFGAVPLAAWIAGVEGGVSAVLLSVVLVDNAIIHPLGLPLGASHLYGEVVFVAVGLALVWQVGRWRRAEQALRESEARAREQGESARRGEAEIASIYDSAPIGLCIFDREGRYLRINQRLAEINGPPPEAHIGRTFREVVPGIADQAEELLREVLETGRPARDIEITGELPSQPGVVRTWSENWFPVRDGRGTVVGVNVAVQEITERKRVEEELRQANQVKDDFLATLSHELRTPLNAILGWAQMLSRGGLDQRLMEQAAQTIFRNAQAQNQLVTDVLDVSRMISGKLRLDVREVDAVALLRHAIESMQPAADAKRLELHMFTDVEPAIVAADPARLQQVFWNLLSNAVKFTEPGGRITARVTRDASALVITVADTGIGIRSEFLPHVFDRFSQADPSTSRQHSGLGLGLSIVRHLVELHGGTVYAMSDGEGRGSTFTVSLPVGAIRQAAPDADAGAGLTSDTAVPADSSLRGLHVLVMDDMEDARTLVAAVLEREGIVVTTAENAEEGLKRLATARPDLIIADIGMPGLDGYEFIHRLRGLPANSGGQTPAIALTAYGSLADRRKTLSAGFVAHLTKPVLRDDLLAAIADWGRSCETR